LGGLPKVRHRAPHTTLRILYRVLRNPHQGASQPSSGCFATLIRVLRNPHQGASQSLQETALGAIAPASVKKYPSCGKLIFGPLTPHFAWCYSPCLSEKVPLLRQVDPAESGYLSSFHSKRASRERRFLHPSTG
jgi:hypothetical protein